MSDFGIETSEERRARYLRLARAATETAAKTPLPAAKEMYVKLAQAWLAMADEHNPGLNVSYESAPETTDVPPFRSPLNVKLNGVP
jgi:formiminotetrahydrofolate cyclodeaminase